MSTIDSTNPIIRQLAGVGARNMTLVAIALAAVWFFTGWSLVLLISLATAGLALGAWLSYFGVIGRAKPLLSLALLTIAAFTLVDGVWTVVFVVVGAFMGLAAFSQKNEGW
ncbi:MAG: hypothetical protein ABI782_00685 [Anaerolineaceae bacterium]